MLIVWKHAPKSLCRFLNRIFGRPILGRSRLVAKWSVETKEDLRKVHGVNVKEEVRKIMTRALEESF